MRRLLFGSVIAAAMIMGCGTDQRSLCERFYEPYPDHVGEGGSPAMAAAMQHYRAGDLVKAAEGLRTVVDKDEHDLNARIYLVSALLGSGEPYKAEMHLDYLENQRDQHFRDQVEWYNALCWLCEGQNGRALQQATFIASSPQHTYKEAAAALAATLSDQ